MIFRVKPVEGGYRVFVGKEDLSGVTIAELGNAIVVATELARVEVARGTPSVQVVVKEQGRTDEYVVSIGHL